MRGPEGRAVFSGWLGVRIAALVAVGGALAACDDFDGWDYGVFDVAQTASADVSCPACDCAQPPVGACIACLPSLEGKAMRFRSLIVTEPTVPTAPDPTALPQFLNKIWQEDVRRYILNILLRIESVDATTGTLTLVGGAGWHELTMDQLPTEPGGEVMQVPSQFFLLPGASEPFTVQLDEKCAFSLTSDPPTLGFHPGPEDHPNICTTAEFGNAIPISNLTPTGEINGTCTGVVRGTLRGCIRKEAADRICSWLPAPDYTEWYYTPNDDFPNAVPGTTDICKAACGVTPGTRVSKWTNFGGFVRIIGVPLGCDADGDGEDDGYAIAGDFEAEIVDIAP